MNSFIKSLLFHPILSLVLTLVASAQTSKIGVVDQQNILTTLQANGSAQKEQDQAVKKLQQELQSLVQAVEEKQRISFENKKKGNIKGSESAEKEAEQQLSGVETKGKELQNTITQFSQSNAKLIQEAIKAVAREKGYTTIIEVNFAPFYEEKDDISTLVLQKLGVIK